MTLKKLADHCHVSVSTVSKAFHNAPDISEETRETIFRAAKELGCYGKYRKEKYNKKSIAVICPETGSDFYTGYIERLRALIEQDNGIVLISADGFDKERQRELLDYYADHLHVDGILIFGIHAPLKTGYDTPIVSLHGTDSDPTDAVYMDMRSPINEAVAHLVKLGHTHVAFLGETLTATKGDMFAEAMAGHQLQPTAQISSEQRFELAGEDGVQRLLEQAPHTTAIICAYDYIALGAIKALNTAGLRVPEDMSVIGIDNIRVTPYIGTSLTSIDTHPDEICAIAWDLLKKKMENHFFRLKQRIQISGSLVVRETTAPPRNENAG